MEDNFLSESGEGQLTERFSIDTRLIGIMSAVAVLGLLLVGVTIIAADTLSAFRSYSTLQTHWTEYRKEASGSLAIYTVSGSEKYYQKASEHIAILQEFKEARREVQKKAPDLSKVKQIFGNFQITEEEVENMYAVYRRFGWVDQFGKSMEVWKHSDGKINQLDSLAQVIHPVDQVSPAQKDKWLAEIEQIDEQITDQQYRIASVLREGANRLRRINLWSALTLGFILVLVGGALSRRFLKSIRKWERTLRINSQRYRSLFDENPNAVYSFDLEGNFVESNKALKKLLSLPEGELSESVFDEFIHPSERKRVRKKFEKAANGVPQTYESVGISEDGEKVHVQVTNLPMYIEDEIVGVYGIAQEISDRVKAEQKVQEQLKEKVVLLEEVHHRVKNNLAFISGLLMLQEDHIDADNARQQLIEAQNRVIAVADIHEIFYDTNNFSDLPLEQYAEKIFSRLLNTFELDDKEITYSIDAVDISLPMNKSIPFGLILNELITNSFKHAFNDRDKGAIALEVRHTNGGIKAVYKDNGKGLPADFDLEENIESSLGMRLIYTFLQQLDADYQLKKGSKNFRLEFTFPA